MKTGVINFYKDARLSSAGAISRLKRFFPRKTKIGHAGTLDPFATGVLVVLIGRATKISEKMMSLPKQYIANIKLGATTLTDDPDSPESQQSVSQVPSIEDISKAIETQRGEILQKPPVYSALKVGGMRACDRTRMGETVELAPRRVKIYDIEILQYNWPMLKIRVDCGRGTYIRSIARDIGEMLGTGGYLTELIRTKIGEFSVENSVNVSDITIENIDQYLTPIPPDFLAGQSSQSQPQPDLQP